MDQSTVGRCQSCREIELIQKEYNTCRGCHKKVLLEHAEKERRRKELKAREPPAPVERNKRIDW